MTITFQKRQKEMKRQEKQREKAARREQKKLAKRAEKEAASESINGNVGVVAGDSAKPELNS
jgi:isoaspartyl peptidase/L-asparaginase-like protein (Ntn-hydrolase superfamily)